MTAAQVPLAKRLLALVLLPLLAATREVTAAAPLLAPASTAAQSSNATRLINVKTALGARGDGSADDGPALQAAMDRARVTRNGIFFPPGTYRVTQPLIFGFWRGIFVRGGEPGDSGIGGGTATVTLAAELRVGAGVCFDFTGAGYGTVEK
jgi:hypothetical protein